VRQLELKSKEAELEASRARSANAETQVSGIVKVLDKVHVVLSLTVNGVCAQWGMWGWCHVQRSPHSILLGMLSCTVSMIAWFV
jgi:hypothetical protein